MIQRFCVGCKSRHLSSLLSQNIPSSFRNLHQYNNHGEWSINPSSGVVSYDGKNMFQTIIGLEIHAQLDIKTKLFSGCPIDSSKTPNASVWPFDIGVPGFLPRLSEEAVRSALLAAGAMKCHIPPVSRFERKHYFYADSPMGYQITQQRWPIARDGVLTCRYSEKRKDNKKKERDEHFTLRIERIQLEQDTGKTLADVQNHITKHTESLVDFNRAGRALIEIVTYPDLRSGEAAANAVETLRNLLKYIGTCDGKMEEGSLRCDLNVSIAPIEVIDDNILSRAGNRVEIKNLNSIRQVQLAAEYEALRQSKAILVDDSPTSQETRTFDIKRNQTVVLRTKEGAKDYRFMPEPDLPPLILNKQTLGEKNVQKFLDDHLPELPDDARQRLIQRHGLSEYLASVLTNDPPAIKFFNESVHEARDQMAKSESSYYGEREKRKIPETVANLLCNELFSLVREFETKRLIEEGFLEESGGSGVGHTSSIRFSRVKGSQLGEIVALLTEGSISNTMAKQLLKALYNDTVKNSIQLTISPRILAQELGYQLITDAEELADICHWTISNSPTEMERYKLGGKFAKKIEKYLFGKAMGKSCRNAHPERLKEILTEILEQTTLSL